MDEEKKQGTFKIDLSSPDTSEDDSRHILSARKPVKPKLQPSETHQLSYIVLGFVAIGIIFIAGYFSLKKQIKTIDTLSTEEMTLLSKELNDKIAIANQLIEDQKKALKEDLSGIGSKIKTIESGIATVNKAEKKGKSELQTSIADIKNEIDPLKKQMDAIKQQLSELSGKTDETMNKLNKFQPAIDKNEKDIAKIVAANVDAAKLDDELTKEKDIRKQAIDSLTSDISSLKKSIKELEEKISKLKMTTYTVPPSSSTTNTKKGSITEEELR